jgi:ubiquinone/menaquinone biosynthesis C-methylase UbiE
MVSTVPARRKESAGLTSGQARRFYDWFGRAQDLQAFYEDRAAGDLLAHGRFDDARTVLEAGCGTGRLAVRLLDGTLPADARYLGADISSTMTALVKARLQAFGGRAQVIRADVTRPLPVASGTFDRVVAVYLLDLLAPGDATALLAEAWRVLRLGGLLCTASLTLGATPATRLASGAWAAAWSRAPWLTGGCRPVTVAPLLDGWHIEHRAQISAWALTSEVVIASRP